MAWTRWTCPSGRPISWTCSTASCAWPRTGRRSYGLRSSAMTRAAVSMSTGPDCVSSAPIEGSGTEWLDDGQVDREALMGHLPNESLPPPRATGTHADRLGGAHEEESSSLPTKGWDWCIARSPSPAPVRPGYSFAWTPCGDPASRTADAPPIAICLTTRRLDRRTLPAGTGPRCRLRGSLTPPGRPSHPTTHGDRDDLDPLLPFAERAAAGRRLTAAAVGQ